MLSVGMEVGIEGENGGGNWRWERGLRYIREVRMGPWDNEGGNLEVWEGSLHCLCEINLQIPITIMR